MTKIYVKLLFFVHFAALIAMGHRTWSNKSTTELKKASLYYARSIENNNHPEVGFHYFNSFSVSSLNFDVRQVRRHKG